MRDALKMFFVLAGVSSMCGLFLAFVHRSTVERITLQQLKYIKGPAINKALSDADNDPLSERKTVMLDGREVTLYLGRSHDTLTGVALETAAQGYGGPVHVITAFDPETGLCKAVAISGSSETPGVGSKIIEPSFTGEFSGIAPDAPAALKDNGGSISGISGATVSSKAVCRAVAEAQKLFGALRSSLPGEKNE